MICPSNLYLNRSTILELNQSLKTSKFISNCAGFLPILMGFPISGETSLLMSFHATSKCSRKNAFQSLIPPSPPPKRKHKQTKPTCKVTALSAEEGSSPGRCRRKMTTKCHGDTFGQS